MRKVYVFFDKSQCMHLSLAVLGASLGPCEDKLNICFLCCILSKTLLWRIGARCSEPFDPSFGYISHFVLNTYK